MKKKSSYVTFRCPASSSPGQWATSTIPFSSKSKGFSIEDFQSYFNTVLSTIWNHQFTSFGNSEASSCLVWLWSNWEFNKESCALKWLGVSLILSCPNFYWGGGVDRVHMHWPAFLLPLAVIMGDLISLFLKFIRFGRGRHPLLPTYKMGTSDCQKGDPRMGHDYDHDQS